MFAVVAVLDDMLAVVIAVADTPAGAVAAGGDRRAGYGTEECRGCDGQQ